MPHGNGAAGNAARGAHLVKIKALEEDMSFFGHGLFVLVSFRVLNHIKLLEDENHFREVKLWIQQFCATLEETHVHCSHKTPSSDLNRLVSGTFSL